MTGCLLVIRCPVTERVNATGISDVSYYRRRRRRSSGRGSRSKTSRRRHSHI